MEGGFPWAFYHQLRKDELREKMVPFQFWWKMICYDLFLFGVLWLWELLSLFLPGVQLIFLVGGRSEINLNIA